MVFQSHPCINWISIAIALALSGYLIVQLQCKLTNQKIITYRYKFFFSVPWWIRILNFARFLGHNFANCDNISKSNFNKYLPFNIKYFLKNKKKLLRFPCLNDYVSEKVKKKDLTTAILTIFLKIVKSKKFLRTLDLKINLLFFCNIEQVNCLFFLSAHLPLFRYDTNVLCSGV